MKITKKEVEHVANLARLELDDVAIQRFADQIGNILAYVDKLKQVDTQGVDPTSHAITLTNAFREDEVRGAPGPRALPGQCARNRKKGCFWSRGS